MLERQSATAYSEIFTGEYISGELIHYGSVSRKDRPVLQILGHSFLKEKVPMNGDVFILHFIPPSDITEGIVQSAQSLSDTMEFLSNGSKSFLQFLDALTTQSVFKNVNAIIGITNTHTAQFAIKELGFQQAKLATDKRSKDQIWKDAALFEEQVARGNFAHLSLEELEAKSAGNNIIVTSTRNQLLSPEINARVLQIASRVELLKSRRP